MRPGPSSSEPRSARRIRGSGPRCSSGRPLVRPGVDAIRSGFLAPRVSLTVLPRPLAIVAVVARIRDAAASEASVLEALQRRSSDVWEEYREQLAAHPDVFELPQAFIDQGWVRVAVDVLGTPIGFSVVVPMDGPVHELDGLFVEPSHMSSGIG